MHRRSLSLTLLLALASSALAAQPGGLSWRIYTEREGLHRVTFDQLVSAAGGMGPVPSASLSLDNRGLLVPLALEDGGDGEFGPGDWFEFAAEILAGPHTYYHPYSRYNVYWLRLDARRARRLPEPEAAADRPADPPRLTARRLVHLERDQLLIRLPAAVVAHDPDPELWYWGKMTHQDAAPFTLEVDVADADLAGDSSLRLGLRGLSTRSSEPSAAKARDHVVQIAAAGRRMADIAWDGRQPEQVYRANPLWPEPDEKGVIRLQVSVPARSAGDDPLVDVVMLDWAEVAYDFNGLVGSDQIELHMPPGGDMGVLELRSDTPGRLIAVGRHSGYREVTLDDDGSARVAVAAGERTLWIRREDSAFSAVAIETDRPSSLSSFERQADYLMIAHGSLVEASRELAEFHRRRGLSVELIDVQDIYDEFGDGIVSPTAIRDFLRHAYFNWSAPRPRFVLLVGDASWDTKNATVDEANYANWVGRQLLSGDRFVAKATQDYDPAKRNDRNLIPSWNFHTNEGHAASDAYYTLLDGNDDLPDIALGRFPVASDAEVRAITRKIERYVSAPLGPWRGRLTWISGALAVHQKRSEMLAHAFNRDGWSSEVILPGPKARVEDRQRILDSFDAGQLVTHFIGHGGRFIWRTGPPDLSKQVDLFRLEDLQELQATADLPVVISVACYSAPFDHPSADSIGEAFLRLEDRGAIAFIGASWRNAPPFDLSQIMVSELARPGTVGEALMRTKRQMATLDSIHLYNLLGDPAVPLAVPPRTVGVTARTAGESLEIEVLPPGTPVDGRVEVSILDANGSPLSRFDLPVGESPLRVSRPLDAAASSVAAYFWDQARGTDGIGGAEITGLAAAGAP